jgi:hypothetical protein
MTSRTVNKEEKRIEVGLRYEDYDFDSRVVVTAKGKAVEIAVWLDKPVPADLVGKAGLNLEFLPSQLLLSAKHCYSYPNSLKPKSWDVFVFVTSPPK